MLGVVGTVTTVLLVGISIPYQPVVSLTLVGLVGIVVLFLNPVVLVHLFVIGSLWDEALGLSNGLSITRLLGILLVMRWLIDIFLRKERWPRLTTLVKACIAFALIAFFSITWSNNRDVSLARSITIAQLLLLFFVIPPYLNSRRGLLYLSMTIAIAAAGMALVVLWQSQKGTGTLDELGLLRSSVNNQVDPNVAAATMTLGYAFSLGLVSFTGGKRLRALGFVCAILTVLGVVATLSRTFILAMALVTLLWLVLWARTPSSRVSSLLIVLAVVAGGAFVMNLFGVDKLIVLRLSTIYDPVVANPRLAIWQVAIAAFKTSPVWGIGLGTFDLNYVFYQGMAGSLSRVWDGARDVHNIYLQVLVDLGATGLFAFLAVIARAGASLRQAWSHLDWDDPAMSVGMALILASAAILFGGFFIPLLFRKALWIIPVLIEAFHRQKVQATSPQKAMI